MTSLALAAGLTATSAAAEPQHGIAMYGAPAMPPDFEALPNVNPDAPKGGTIVFGEGGGFDSLNPHILRGSAPYGVQTYVFQSLMARAWNEPFTLYGALAESVEVPEDRSWVEFTLNPDARFSDGSAVTVEDVLWSFETLGTEGHPRYRNSWSKIETAEAVGERTVRFEFNTDDRELPMILGLRPVLKKSQWEGKDFQRSGFDVVPIGSGPYVIGDYEPGRHIELNRDADWWAADLPAMRGQHNIDTIRYEFFGDADVIFEAFKAGDLSSYREGNAAKWAANYDFPRAREGEVVKSSIAHERPSGIRGLVMNTRREVFADWRVREAMLEVFNFAFINQVLTGGELPRITSYFSNSELGMREGPAEGQVAALLAPFEGDLLPGALEGYALPEGDGSERNRRGIRRALGLMEEAGWTVQDGRMANAEGEPFEFEILLNQSAPASQGAESSGEIVDLFAGGLRRLGITPAIRRVDAAQYQERTDAFEFDMTWYNRSLSLSPGNEQYLYWGAEAADTPGSLNWMGVRSEAVEAMIEAMLNARGRNEFVAATRALDRVLTTGRYVIPIWYAPESYIAHDATLAYPDQIAIYGDYIGFQPDVWWREGG